LGIILVENENKFVEYLRFQISQKYKSDQIVKNISMFHTQLEDRNEKMIQMIDFYEDMKRKDIYNLLVQEFNNLIEK